MLLIRLIFGILSAITPKFAAKRAFRLFQKVQKKEIREREKPFYEIAKKIEIPGNEDVLAYESGNVNGPLVILIHGWDSNPGSLSLIERKLDSLNYRIISFTIPAHGLHNATHTNMFEAKVAFKALINHLNPQEPFDAVTHSFGSGVLAYGMSELPFKLDKAVLLTSPNVIMDIFLDYKQMINLSDKSFEYLCVSTNEVLGEDINELNMSSKLKSSDFQRIKIIHDKQDKVIPYQNGVALSESNPKVQLETYENIGHYRMLWNDQVLHSVVDFLKVG